MAIVLRVMTALPGFERELRLLPGIVRRGDVCLDIGASLGVYSMTLAAIVGRRGAVHAVEPRRSAARRLRRLATIDELRQRVGRRIALIKCDVEGFELAVLRGATSVLHTDQPMILCEIETRHTARYGHHPDDVEAFLRSHHYHPVELNGSNSDGGRNQLWAPRGRQLVTDPT